MRICKKNSIGVDNIYFNFKVMGESDMYLVGNMDEGKALGQYMHDNRISTQDCRSFSNLYEGVVNFIMLDEPCSSVIDFVEVVSKKLELRYTDEVGLVQDNAQSSSSDKANNYRFVEEKSVEEGYSGPVILGSQTQRSEQANPTELQSEDILRWLEPENDQPPCYEKVEVRDEIRDNFSVKEPIREITKNILSFDEESNEAEVDVIRSAQVVEEPRNVRRVSLDDAVPVPRRTGEGVDFISNNKDSETIERLAETINDLKADVVALTTQVSNDTLDMRNDIVSEISKEFAQANRHESTYNEDMKVNFENFMTKITETYDKMCELSTELCNSHSTELATPKIESQQVELDTTQRKFKENLYMCMIPKLDSVLLQKALVNILTTSIEEQDAGTYSFMIKILREVDKL